MDCDKVKSGLKIRTNKTLRTTDGMLVSPKYLNQRKPNTVGVVLNYVGGHGGDLWWVIYDLNPFKDPNPDLVAPFCFDEFEEFINGDK